MENKSHRECAFVGGVLFTLFSVFKQASRIDENGYAVPVNDPFLFQSYMETVTGESLKTGNPQTFKKYTERYKGCRHLSSPMIVLDSAEWAEKYHSLVKTEEGYDELVGRMTAFIRKCIDTTKKEMLVKVILEQIQYDDRIPMPRHFYVDGYEIPSTKGQIVNCKYFDLSMFLVGVTDYLLQHARGRNEDGRQTLEMLGELKSNGQRDLSKYQFGDKIPRSIQVDFPDKNVPRMIPAPTSAGISENNGEMDALSTVIHNQALLEKDVFIVVSTKTTVTFYDIYVPLDLVLYNTSPDDTENCLRNPTMHSLSARHPHSIIVGTGGAGKTMTLKGYFLEAAVEYQRTGFLPVFLPLREYTKIGETLTAFATRFFQTYCPRVNEQMILAKIKSKSLCFLLDGFDEMPRKNWDCFCNMVDTFIRVNPETPIIMSSRNLRTLDKFPNFVKWDCMEMSLGKCLELVKKYPGDIRTELRDEFAERLKKDYYARYPMLVGNPLMLMLMIREYNPNYGIAENLTSFYFDAFQTLYREHDESKKGFKRIWYTSLKPREFTPLFSAFCFITYQKGETSFTKDSFCKYMKLALSRNTRISVEAEPIDFLYDAAYTIGVMREEDNGRFIFLHDVFQQYFTSVFLSDNWSRRDAYLGYFDRSPGDLQSDDETFRLFYEMRKRDMDNEVYFPKYKKLLEECDDCPDPYWAFLEKLYPEIVVNVLYPDRRLAENKNAKLRVFSLREPEKTRSVSYLYDTFMAQNRMSHTADLQDWDWPSDILHSLHGELYYWDDDFDPYHPHEELLSDETVIHSMELSAIEGYDHGDENIAGFTFRLNLCHVIDRTESGRKLGKTLTDDYFPLRLEYEELCRWVKYKEEEITTDGNAKSLLEALGFES